MKCLGLLTSLLLFALVGCATYPMGLTKEQWNTLSPEQQSDYRVKQSQLDEQNRQANEALRREQLSETNERLATIYADPQYGDIIVVTIDGGEIGIGNKRQRYLPVHFLLARGEVKVIPFINANKPASFRQIQMQLSEDGRTFCFDPGMKQIQICDDGWALGRTYYPSEVNEISVFSGAKDIRIRIRFKHQRGDRPEY